MRRSLEGEKNSLNLKPDWIIKGFFFLMLLYTCYNLFMSQYHLFKVFELKRATKSLEVQIEQYRAENQKMEYLLRLVKEHPEHFKEKFARRYMQMQKEGERILILKD